ncbi:MAG TPA: hypothetical protein VFY89_09850 [Ktedonobacterales bacterium]
MWRGSGWYYPPQSTTELRDTVAATLAFSTQYPTLSNLRFILLPGGQIQRVL